MLNFWFASLERGSNKFGSYNLSRIIYSLQFASQGPLSGDPAETQTGDYSTIQD
jgi:hypothetical protein